MNKVIVSPGLALIVNRESIAAADALGKVWIHIVPKGELPNAEAGIVQVLDDQALDAILADLQSEKARLGDRWPGLYMGHEHDIYDPAKSSEAFVWGKEFEKRSDGIWSAGDATDVGEPAIKNKRFKYTSFVADPAKPGSVQRLDGNRVRILKIDTVGFTNYPNGRQLLTPISNRTNFAAASAAADSNQPTPTKRTKMKSVCTALGLSADASEDAALAEVQKLKNRADVSPAELTALRNRAEISTGELTQLKTENATLLEEQIDSDLAANRITDEGVIAQLKPVLQTLKNREARTAFITTVVGKVTTEANPQRKLQNRDTRTPAGGQAEDDTAQKVGKIRNRADALKKEGHSHDSAWAQAASENK